MLWAFSALVAASACGSSSTETPKKDFCAAGSCPFDYSQFDGTTPQVSYETDVLPIFRRSCGLSPVCHGSTTSGGAKLYLGPALTDATPDAAARQTIVDALVGQPSKTAPSTNIVASTDPEHSFLMLKMDGCQNSAGLTCTAQPAATCDTACGDPMPQTGDRLAASERDVVRRWIAQGAQNN
jgi:hypothetical protein